MPKKKPPNKAESLELPFDQSAETDLIERDSNDGLFDLQTKSGHVDHMFSEWFLDYASYVILERAVPHANDGLSRSNGAFCVCAN